MSDLVVSGLSAGYTGADVLNDVSLRIGAGEVVVVLGANGAGKTTLMRALSGLLRRAGSISFDGVDISRAEPEQILRHGIAHVPQGRGTFTELSVEENLRIGGYILPRRVREAELDYWYTMYPVLAERRKQPAGLLSGGEQQMLAIARALRSRPRLLLCDEPSLGLSPLLTERLFESLGALKTELEMSVLVVEQNARVVLDIADCAYLLRNGRISRRYPIVDLAEDDALRAAYLGG